MSHKVVLPGSTIGIFGSGQLGRMFTLVAKRMGYRVCVFSPDAQSPTGQVCDHELVAHYDDREAVEDFARQCDVITLEFENIPVETVRWASAITPVHPGESVLQVAQDRVIEKQSLADAGLPVTPFRAVRDRNELESIATELGLPIVIKTTRSGYDGKGQRIVRESGALSELAAQLDGPLIAEKMIDFDREVSILVFRGLSGESGTFPLIENHHANHILDFSICPAPDSDSLQESARKIALQTAECLDLVGLLCIEMFVQRDGTLLINEIAPRPHNSGHLTIEAFVCCQYEQQLRAICGLPAGSTAQTAPAAMANLLGDIWENGTPDFNAATNIEEARLHLYGKASARVGRKMGHITATGLDTEQAVQRATSARTALSQS